MKHPFKVGDIVETKKYKHRGLVLQTDSLPGGTTIDVFWFETGDDAILCETQWFSLVSRAER